jgi:hypothetical protein
MNFVRLLALLLVTCPLASAADNKKPNVLFIAVDDFKPLLGCHGTSWIQTPNIDRLAARGSVFLANYCQVPLCAPSRASLLTGLRPDSIGLYFNPFKNKNVLRQRLPDVVTLPQYFRDQGYVTCGMGKVFDGRTVDEGHDAVSWSLPCVARFEFAPCGPGVRGPETQERLKRAQPGEHVAGPPTESCQVPDDAYVDGAMARTVAATIRQLAEKTQPFFLTVGFIRPHLRFIAPKKYWDLYGRGALSLAAFQELPFGSQREAQVVPNSGELRDYAGVPQSGPIPEALQRELLHGYAASVSYIDAQVGLLLKALDETGVADNTIVCILGMEGIVTMLKVSKDDPSPSILYGNALLVDVAGSARGEKPGELSISRLDPNTNYDLVLFGRDFSHGTKFLLDGVEKKTTGVGPADIPMQEGRDCVVYRAVNSGSNGVIVVKAEGTTSGAILAGLSIAPSNQNSIN